MSDRALLEELSNYIEDMCQSTETMTLCFLKIRDKNREIRTRMAEEPRSCLSCEFELKSADSNECAFCKVLRSRLYDYTHWQPKIEKKDGN